jgi:hypothetical protein
MNLRSEGEGIRFYRAGLMNLIMVSKMDNRRMLYLMEKDQKFTGWDKYLL